MYLKRKALVVFLLCLLILLSLFSASCSSKMKAGMSSEKQYDEIAEDINGGLSKVNLSSSNTNKDLEMRKLIKDVTLHIETKNFDQFISKLNDEINKHSGFVQKSDINGSSYDSYPDRTATIIVRIPADKLDSFTGKASSLGNVTSKTEGTEDVTMEYVDIESRIKALKTEQESLLKLMEKANNLNDILTIQNHLTDVSSELESYEAKLRTYKDLIAYSTVTMEIYEVERETPTEKLSMWEEIGNNLSNNLASIGKGARDFFVWFISALPYLVIIAVLALIVLVVVRISIKRSRVSNRLPDMPKSNDHKTDD
jgi:hypothetical protein